MTFARCLKMIAFMAAPCFAIACGADPSANDEVLGRQTSSRGAAPSTEDEMPETDMSPLHTSEADHIRELPALIGEALSAPDAPALPAPPETPAAPTGPEAPAAPALPSPATPLARRGVNLSGAEFGGALPGVERRDYTWPSSGEVDYYMSKGMNMFRVNFRWERLQPVANGELVAAYGSSLDAIVGYATSKRATVLLNPQNFARYYGTTVGSATVPASVFADFWRRLAARYKSNPRVIFGLVNEPHDISTEQWVSAANAAIAAIRSTGAMNTIYVPGNGWTGAHAWNSTGYGTSNAVAMLEVVDPMNNMVFEAHQYLDDASAGGSTCTNATAGRDRLVPFVSWLRKHGKRGFIGEFATANNPTCDAALKDMLRAMMEASDVLDGWAWWGGGPVWSPGYPFALDPKNGKDAPQMSLLAPYLVGLPLF